MSSPAIASRSFPSTRKQAFATLMKELFQATPLYLLVSSLRSR